MVGALSSSDRTLHLWKFRLRIRLGREVAQQGRFAVQGYLQMVQDLLQVDDLVHGLALPIFKAKGVRAEAPSESH